MWKNFNKYINLPKQEKKLLLEALLFSIYVRLWLMLFPFKWIEKKLGSKEPVIYETTNIQEKLLLTIKKSIKRIANHTWWRNQCIEQSLTALLMLKKRKINYVISFGATTKNSQLKAHVWIRSGSFFIVDKGTDNYALIIEYYG